jgi:hypothetical protein
VLQLRLTQQQTLQLMLMVVSLPHLLDQVVVVDFCLKLLELDRLQELIQQIQ